MMRVIIEITRSWTTKNKIYWLINILLWEWKEKTKLKTFSINRKCTIISLVNLHIYEWVSARVLSRKGGHLKVKERTENIWKSVGEEVTVARSSFGLRDDARRVAFFFLLLRAWHFLYFLFCLTKFFIITKK